MKNSSCKISVIIRSYNSESFIKDAIQSALDQSLSKKLYEIVVIDDGSSDNTLTILENYKKQLRIIKQPHLGPIKALNIGVKESKENHIIILDSDDTFKRNILEKLYFAIKKGKNVKFSYCDYKEAALNKKNKVISLKENIFNSIAGGIMYKKELLEEFNGYDENLIFPEYDLLFKVSRKYKGAYIQEPLYVYRRRKNSITGDKNIVELGKKQLFSKYGVIKGLRNY
ncbi:glycosyltransferase family 2 protein [Patescibacteria group bacterium]|nr:glycosyltransferase family 2 protein [Patescibacteria group bacterium]MCG2700524.1 glycosyltransferase family 2 protein [Candidatus Parcubacteria bacterium]